MKDIIKYIINKNNVYSSLKYTHSCKESKVNNKVSRYFWNVLITFVILQWYIYVYIYIYIYMLKCYIYI